MSCQSNSRQTTISKTIRFGDFIKSKLKIKRSEDQKLSGEQGYIGKQYLMQGA